MRHNDEVASFASLYTRFDMSTPIDSQSVVLDDMLSTLMMLPKGSSAHKTKIVVTAADMTLIITLLTK